MGEVLGGLRSGRADIETPLRRENRRIGGRQFLRPARQTGHEGQTVQRGFLRAAVSAC